MLSFVPPRPLILSKLWFLPLSQLCPFILLSMHLTSSHSRPTGGVPLSLPVTEPLLCAKNILDALSYLICNQDCQVGVTVYLSGEETEALRS